MNERLNSKFRLIMNYKTNMIITDRTDVTFSNGQALGKKTFIFI